MQNWRLHTCENSSDLEIVLDKLNEKIYDQEDVYYHTNCVLKLLKTTDLLSQIQNLFSERYVCQQLSQTQYEQFEENLFQAINFYQGGDEEFAEGINLISNCVLSRNSTQFCSALLSNKALLSSYPKMVLAICSQALQQGKQEIHLKIISMLGQPQLKSYHHQFLIDLVKADHQTKVIQSFLTDLFNSFLENTQKIEINLSKITLNKQTLVLAIKRVVKWETYEYKSFVEKLDHYCQTHDKINDSELLKLIFYIMTSNTAQIWMNYGYLSKTIKVEWKTNNDEFYLQRIFKLLRINHHRDNDCSYRIGFNGLMGQKIDFFRLAQDIQSDVTKALKDNHNNKGVLLKFIKQTFKREPFSFSYSFIQFIIMFNYESDSSLYNIYWSLISKIYRFFFTSLYQQGIKNVFDFEGMFLDDQGKTRLITKIGNMKKNARNLVPYFQQLIINSQNIIPMIIKKFYKLFLSPEQIETFHLNFIYEPTLQNPEQLELISGSFKKNRECLQLQQLFPTFLDSINQIQSIFYSYCSDLLQVKTDKVIVMQQKFHTIIKKYEKIDQPSFCLTIMQNIHQQISSYLFGSNNFSILKNYNEKIIQLKTALGLLSQQQQKSNLYNTKEFKYFEEIMCIQLKVNYNINFNLPEARSLLLSLLQAKEKHNIEYYQKQINKLIESFGSLLQENGYQEDDKVISQFQHEEIENRDDMGQIYYSIIENEKQLNPQLRVVPTLKQQFFVFRYLQLLDKLLQEAIIYNFNVELLIDQLRHFFNIKYFADELIFVIWDQIYLILEKLNKQSCEKWLEQKQNKSIYHLLHLEQTISISSLLIIDIIINQKQLEVRKINLIKLLSLISEHQNILQKKYLYSLIFKYYKVIQTDVLNYIYFTQTELVMQQCCLPKLLNQITFQPQILQSFEMLTQVFLLTQVSSIQVQIMQFISQNLKALGIPYLLIILLGICTISLKTQQIAKSYFSQYADLLQQQNDIQKYLLIINPAVYLVCNFSGNLNTVQLRWFFQKVLKYIIPQRIRNNSRKINQFTSFFQSFFSISAKYYPKKTDLQFSIFENLKVIKQKFADKAQISSEPIRNYYQVIQILQQSYNNLLSNLKKNIEASSQSQINPFDPLFFEEQRDLIKEKKYENQSQVLKQRSQYNQQSPIQFFSEIKTTNNKSCKITKTLDNVNLQLNINK